MPSSLCPSCRWGHQGTTMVSDSQLIMMKPAREPKQSALHNMFSNHASWWSNWLLSSNIESGKFKHDAQCVLLLVGEETGGGSVSRGPFERRPSGKQSKGEISLEWLGKAWHGCHGYGLARLWRPLSEGKDSSEHPLQTTQSVGGE